MSVIVISAESHYMKISRQHKLIVFTQYGLKILVDLHGGLLSMIFLCVFSDP